MYKVFSNHYGSMTHSDNLEEAISKAKHYKNCQPKSIVSIWKDGKKIMEVK